MNALTLQLKIDSFLRQKKDKYPELKAPINKVYYRILQDNHKARRYGNER